MKQIICSSDLDSDGLPRLWIIPYSFLSLSTPEAKWVLQLLIELSDFSTLCAIERIINSTLQIRKLRQGVETISWRSHRESETDKSQISQSNALSVEHCSFSTQTATRNETHSKHKQLKQHFIKDKSCWNSSYAGDPKHCFLLSLSHCFKCRLLLLPSFLPTPSEQHVQHMLSHCLVQLCSPPENICPNSMPYTALYACHHHFHCNIYKSFLIIPWHSWYVTYMALSLKRPVSTLHRHSTFFLLRNYWATSQTHRARFNSENTGEVTIEQILHTFEICLAWPHSGCLGKL